MGRLGEPYLTMDYAYQARILREFSKISEAGLVYKGKKPVHWCSSCVTALAEAEVEYADKTSPSVYVPFEIDPVKFEENVPGILKTGKRGGPHMDDHAVDPARESGDSASSGSGVLARKV